MLTVNYFTRYPLPVRPFTRLPVDLLPFTVYPYSCALTNVLFYVYVKFLSVFHSFMFIYLFVSCERLSFYFNAVLGQTFSNNNNNQQQ